MGYQLSREDTSRSGRKPFIEGKDLLREEVIHQKRGPFIKVEKRPFVKGGHSLPNTQEETLHHERRLHIKGGRQLFVMRGRRLCVMV